MPTPIYRYPLDKTGTNPDNLVVGEIHTLSSARTRGAATTYGPFYADALRVYDDSTNQLLQRNVHYSCIELLQDASAMTGKDIYCIVLITDPNVSHRIRLNYQVLGGAFTNSAEAIVNMYETITRDNRPVPWVNVLNKPTSYNPGIHRHLLEDLFGFEALVGALERVRNAIILTDVPAFETLIDWFNQHVDDLNNPHKVNALQVGLGKVENLPVVTTEEIDQGIAVHSYVTYDRMLYAFQKLGLFRVFRLTPSMTFIKEGYTLTVTVNTSNVDNDTRLYWNVTNVTTVDADFDDLVGTVVVVENRAQFMVRIRQDQLADPDTQFRVSLHVDSPVGVVVATTPVLTILDVAPLPVDDTIDLLQMCCINDVVMSGRKLDARALFFVGQRDHDTQQHRFLSPLIVTPPIDLRIAMMLATQNLYSWPNGVDAYSLYVFTSKDHDQKARRFLS